MEFNDMSYDELLETIFSYLDKIKVKYVVTQRKDPTHVKIYKHNSNDFLVLFIHRETSYTYAPGVDEEPVKTFTVMLSYGFQKSYRINNMKEFKKSFVNLL